MKLGTTFYPKVTRCKNDGQPFGTRSRVRRSERAQHFYAARTFSDEEIKNEEQPSNAQALDKKSASESSVTAPTGEAYLPNEPLASQKEAQERYTPNDISAPADEPAAEGNAPQIDFSAYYRRDGSASEGEGSEPAFAPPSSWIFPVMTIIPGMKGRNRNRKATSTVRARPPGADTARRDVLAADGVGYQVQESDAPGRRRHRRNMLRNTLIALVALVVLAGGVWVFREPITKWLGQSGIVSLPVKSRLPRWSLPSPWKDMTRRLPWRLRTARAQPSAS